MRGNSLFFAVTVALALGLANCAAKPVWEPYQGAAKGLYPGQHWQMAANPKNLGWSSEKLAQAKKYAKTIGSSAVMIIHDGVIIGAWGDVTRKFKCHSMRKSLLSALMGVYVDKGVINLNRTLRELGIDDNPPCLSPEEKQASIGDLLKSRSGVYHPAIGEAGVMKILRPKRYSHRPGSFWYYNNWDFNALGTIFQKETNKDIFKEFQRSIAGPLKMEDFQVGDCWYQKSPVSIHSKYGFRMSARDLARFGLLFLRQGKWRDKQILSKTWVQESTASYSSRGVDGGYGYMWWTGTQKGLIPNLKVKGHCFFASGFGEQMVVVLPYRKLVVVHLVDTDKAGQGVFPHQIGRLLWFVLRAAGETDAGEDPSIEAAGGIRLSGQRLQKRLAAAANWIGPANGLFNRGKLREISFSPAGKFSVSQDGKPMITGKWQIYADGLVCEILGMKMFFYVIQKGDALELFDPTGTLFGKFHPRPR